MRYYIVLFSCLFCLSAFAQDDLQTVKGHIDNYQYNKALSLIEEGEPTQEMLFMKAMCYKGLDNYKAAVDILVPLSEVYVNNPKILSELAICYQAMSNWEKSLKCYEDLISADSTNVFYKKQRADMLFRLENYGDALKEYQALTENYRMDNLIKRSAQCFELMNMADSALVYYKQAWARDSTDAFSVANIVNINLKQYNQNPGDQEAPEYIMDAIECSEMYIKRDSTDKQINLLNALSYYTMDMYIEAIPRLEKCYLAGDSSLIVNRSLGMSLYSMGLNEDAKPYLLKAYERDSANVNVIYCLGVVSNELREYENGQRYFTRLIDRAIPKDLTYYSYYKGLAKAQQGNEHYRDAIDNYKIAEKHATKNQKIALYYEIAVIYDYDLAMPDEALAYYINYRSSMEDYLVELIGRDATPNTIAEMEGKLKGLNSHITRLEKEIAKKN